MGKRPSRHVRKVRCGKGRKKTKKVLVNPKIKKSRAALQISPVVQHVRREGIKADVLAFQEANKKKFEKLKAQDIANRRTAYIAAQRRMMMMPRLIYYPPQLMQVPQQRIMYNQPQQVQMPSADNSRQLRINKDLEKSLKAQAKARRDIARQQSREKRAENIAKFGKELGKDIKYAQVGAKFLGGKVKQAYGKWQVNQMEKARQKSENIEKMEQARQKTIDKYGLGG